MPTMDTILLHAAALLAAGLLFAWLEHRWPAEPGLRWWRRPLGIDLAYWFSGPVFNQLAVLLALALIGLGLLAVLGEALDRHFIERLQQGRPWIRAWPLWLQGAAAFVVADFTLYWTHRAFHRVPFLWAMHAVHHSPTRLDWLAAVRGHPFNAVLGTLVLAGVLAACGFPLGVLAGVVPLIGLLALLGHANVRWEFGPFRLLFASPRFHRWHHTATDEGGDRNFANFLPVWDRLFGTWHLPLDRQPQRFGIAGDVVPQRFLGQLWHPLRVWHGWLRGVLPRRRERLVLAVGMLVLALLGLSALHAPLATLMMQSALPRVVDDLHLLGYRRSGPPPVPYGEGEGVRFTLPSSDAHRWFIAAAGIGVPSAAADPGACLWGEARHPDLGLPLPLLVTSTLATEPPRIDCEFITTRVNAWLLRGALQDGSPWVLRLDAGTSVTALAEAAPAGWDRTVGLHGRGMLVRRDGQPGLLRIDRLAAHIDLRLHRRDEATGLTARLRVDDLALTEVRSGGAVPLLDLLRPVVAAQINQALARQTWHVPFVLDPASGLRVVLR
jgi:sterol desaturase/sphingolipid hydroxylase (fatty acid hydroxylase superfamily)